MTKNWDDLSDKLKKMIVDEMDLETRVRLKRCSKAMKALTESAPIYVNEVKLEDEYNYPDSDDDYDFHYVISKQFEVDDHVLRAGDEEIEKVNEYGDWDDDFETYDDYDVHPQWSIKQYFTKFMLPGNVHMNVFETNTEVPEELKASDIKINTKKLEVGGDCDAGNAMEYINRMTLETKVVKLYYSRDKKTPLVGLGLNPVIINADELVVLRKSDINDEQLLSFKCRKLSLDHSDVTLEGLNKFIKKWLAEDYPIGSKIHYRQDVDDWDKLMEELNYEPIEWTKEKEKKMRIGMDSQKEMFIHYERTHYKSRPDDSYDFDFESFNLYITIQEVDVDVSKLSLN